MPPTAERRATMARASLLAIKGGVERQMSITMKAKVSLGSTVVEEGTMTAPAAKQNIMDRKVLEDMMTTIAEVMVLEETMTNRGEEPMEVIKVVRRHTIMTAEVEAMAPTKEGDRETMMIILGTATAGLKEAMKVVEALVDEAAATTKTK